MSFKSISEQDFDKIVEAGMRFSMKMEKIFMAEFNALSYGTENDDFIRMRGEVFTDYLIGTMCALMSGISFSPNLKEMIAQVVEEKLEKLEELKKESENGVRENGHNDDSVPPSIL